MLPKKSDSEIHKEMELLAWKAPAELVNIAVDSIDELKDKLSLYNIDCFFDHRKGNEKHGYDVYSFSEKNHEYKFNAAYGCHKCEKIIIGPPIIEAESSVGIMPLTGREGIDYYCSNCNNHMYQITLELS